MKPPLANLVNSIILLTVGSWGYAASGYQYITALIAPVFGLLFLGLHHGLVRERRYAVYPIIGLTLLLLIALVRPLTRELGQQDYAGVARVALMMFSCMVASVRYFQHFVYDEAGNIKL